MHWKTCHYSKSLHIFSEYCLAENVSAAVGVLRWPKTVANMTQVLNCPTTEGVNVTRYCDFTVGWKEADTTKCKREMTTKNADNTLDEYAEKGDTKGASKVIQKILAEKIVKKNATSQQVTKAVDGLKKITDAIKSEVVDKETAKYVIKSFDNVLSATAKASEKKKDMVKKETGIKFMEMVNNITTRLAGDDIIVRPENNSIVTLAVMKTTEKRYVQLAITRDENTVATKAVDTPDTADSYSISVPSNAVNTSGNAVKFMFMAKNVFLRAAVDLSEDQTVSDQILSAKVGKSVKDLNPPVVIKFTVRKGPQSFTCVFWDETTNKLSSEGCKTNKSETETNTSVVVTCHCNHLTNFALLMTAYSGSLSKLFVKMMSVFSYLGTILSVLGLAMTIVTYLKFKKLRKSLPGRILLCLTGTLLLANLVFIAGAWYKPRPDVGADWRCKLVGMLLHYFYLSTMLWSSAESVQYYHVTMKVFDSHISNFLLKAGAVAWVVPAVVVAITAGVSKGGSYKLIGNSGDGVENTICFIESKTFYGTFMTPILLLMIGNVVVFVLVLRKMHAPSQARRVADGKSTTARQVRGAIGLCMLLGLTWIFGVFALDRVSSMIFQPLFVITHTLQGAVIFVIHCLMKPEVTQSWSKYVPCLRSLVKPDKSTITSPSSGNTRNAAGMQTSSQTPSSMDSCVSYRNVKNSGLPDEVEIKPLVK